MTIKSTFIGASKTEGLAGGADVAEAEGAALDFGSGEVVAGRLGWQPRPSSRRTKKSGRAPRLDAGKNPIFPLVLVAHGRVKRQNRLGPQPIDADVAVRTRVNSIIT